MIRAGEMPETRVKNSESRHSGACDAKKRALPGQGSCDAAGGGDYAFFFTRP